MPQELRPTTFEAAAEALSSAASGGESVRVIGGATKLGWGNSPSDAGVELRTSALDRIVEHNAGDLTAVVQAGVPLALAQETFARTGQMLAVDPWLGPRQEATLGGVIATGDSGPLRHRYGSVRDLVVGMTVALSDGTIAKSGGKVIKNVAGYDVAKLLCGSFGTLGLILEVNVRLHPLPAQTVTAAAMSDDPHELAAAGRSLASRPLELEALDVAWKGGRGQVLARCGGAAALERAQRVARELSDAGLERVETVLDDAELWARQRADQRSADGALVRVAARPSQLEATLGAVRRRGGTLVGRIALGLSFIALEPGEVVGLLGDLPPGAWPVLLDAPAELRDGLDTWGDRLPPAALELIRRVKARFDPAGTCNPGLYVGGI